MSKKIEATTEKKKISPWKKYTNIVMDVMEIISSLLNIGFTVIMIAVGLGNFILNVIMLSFLGVLLVYPIIKLIFGFNSPKHKKVTRTIKIIKKWFKRIFKLAMAGYLIYSLIVIGNTPSSPMFAVFGAVITVIVFAFLTMVDVGILLLKLLMKSRLKDILRNILDNKNELFSILIARTDDIRQPAIQITHEEVAAADETKEEETEKKLSFFKEIKRKNQQKREKRKREKEAADKINAAQSQTKKELTLDDVKENIVVKKDKILDIIFKKKEVTPPPENNKNNKVEIAPEGQIKTTSKKDK